MKGNIAFRVVVFPEAVSPDTNSDIPYSRQIQTYAATCEDIVPHWISCVIEIVSSANFLIVKDGPIIDTSSENMILIREPSSNAPSIIGLLSDTGRPIRSLIARKYLASKSLSLNRILEVTIPKTL